MNLAQKSSFMTLVRPPSNTHRRRCCCLDLVHHQLDVLCGFVFGGLVARWCGGAVACDPPPSPLTRCPPLLYLYLLQPKKAGAQVVSGLAPEYVRYLTDMHSDFCRSQEDSEIILKTRGDWWVVGRKSDQREFFVILNVKNANLIDINEEIRRLSATHFGNIFFVSGAPTAC